MRALSEARGAGDSHPTDGKSAMHGASGWGDLGSLGARMGRAFSPLGVGCRGVDGRACEGWVWWRHHFLWTSETVAASRVFGRDVTTMPYSPWGSFGVVLRLRLSDSPPICLSPIDQSLRGLKEALSEACNFILNAGRYFGEEFACHQPVPFKILEGDRQHPLRNAWNRAFELRESRASSEEVERQNQKDAPLITDPGQQFSDCHWVGAFADGCGVERDGISWLLHD